MKRLLPILIIAFILRAAGSSFGLPAVYHQDEPIVVNHALAYGAGDFNPHFFKIPPLTSYLLFIVFGLYYLVLSAAQHISKEAFLVMFLKDPGVFYFLGRALLGVAAGSASVLILHRMVRRMMTERAAALSSLFFAISYLHVRDSHYVYADIPMLLAVLSATAFFAAYTLKPSTRSVLMGGFFCGAAIAFKYNAAPVAVAGLSAILLSGANAKLRHALTGMLAMLAGFVLLNPYCLLDAPFFLKELASQATVETPMPLAHHLTYSLFEGVGMPITLLGTAGLLWMLRVRKCRWIPVFPALWFAMIALFSQPYERYAIPLVPFLCLGSAFFIYMAAERLRAPGSRQTVIIILTVVCVWQPLVKSIYLDALLMRPDTRTLAAEWARQKLPQGTGIAVDDPFYAPRLPQTSEQWLAKVNAVDPSDVRSAAKISKIRALAEASKDRKSFNVFFLNRLSLPEAPFLTWSPLIQPDLEELKNAGVRYVVRYRFPGESQLPDGGIYRNAQPVAVFSPYRSAQKMYTVDKWSNTALPYAAAELFSRKNPGPYLEIYELSR